MWNLGPGRTCCSNFDVEHDSIQFFTRLHRCRASMMTSAARSTCTERLLPCGLSGWKAMKMNQIGESKPPPKLSRALFYVWTAAFGIHRPCLYFPRPLAIPFRFSVCTSPPNKYRGLIKTRGPSRRSSGVRIFFGRGHCLEANMRATWQYSFSSGISFETLAPSNHVNLRQELCERGAL